MYGTLSVLVDFFYPSVKLIKKTRCGSKVRRIYDQPQTPYQRMLQSPAVDAEVKARLKQRYETLNPVAFKRELTRLTDHLLRVQPRRHRPRRGRATDERWRQPGGADRSVWDISTLDGPCSEKSTHEDCRHGVFSAGGGGGGPQDPPR